MQWIFGSRREETADEGDQEDIEDCNLVIQTLVLEREDLQKTLSENETECAKLESRVSQMEIKYEKLQIQLKDSEEKLRKQDRLMQSALPLAGSILTATSQLKDSLTHKLTSSIEDARRSEALAIVDAHVTSGVMTEAEGKASKDLVVAGNQSHLFSSWPAPGCDDLKKRQLLSQIHTVNQNYTGGLKAYISNARRLLEDSRAGVNPLSGWTPSVPEGRSLEYGSADFLEQEQQGVGEVARAAFVLVAGGLGERLGYSGIKVALPVERSSDRCFLGLYIESILTLQRLSAQSNGGVVRELPLAIMTSDDTHSRTLELLKSNSYFGMKESQVHLLKQEKVPCLTNNAAILATAPGDPYKLQTKPHGHGDVHTLLHSSGLLQKWLAEGFKWICFFQDTNALVFRAITAAIGVSASSEFDVNSLAVPRKAKEAIGGIAKLTSASGKSMTLNVEYNQLDPLLRDTVNPEGDVNDPATAHSPFPGNINQLVLALESYAAQLQRTGGAIAEFVNPKYKNAERTEFKAPTRLECMMQDYPKNLPEDLKVGFTTMPVWAAYSPVKNSPEEARGKYKTGSPCHSATSGEFDMYAANSKIFQMVGAKIEEPKDATFNGVTLKKYPSIVWSPSWAVTFSQVQSKLPGEQGLFISQRSTLILDGANISISGLHLDGALIIRCAEGASVRIEDLTVQNPGWRYIALDETDEAIPEVDRIRGFQIVRDETKEFVFNEPGEHVLTKCSCISKRAA